jgi:hypothetical protein
MLLVAPLAHAADPSGHWRGTIAIPGAPAVAEIDLDRGVNGDWVGSLTAADFKLRGTPLLDLKVADAKVDATLGEAGGFGGGHYDLLLCRRSRRTSVKKIRAVPIAISTVMVSTATWISGGAPRPRQVW